MSILLVACHVSAQDSTESQTTNLVTVPLVDITGGITPVTGDTLAAGMAPGGDVDIDDELDQLLDQDISSLRRTSVTPALDVEVSSVSRQKSTIGRSPAAVFVIDEEMIRRSGARRLPDLLRMVPGLFVGNIDGSKWSISSRGFANRFANKLLVQIDGRTVYTPLFGGVFWDVQDLLLDDIKRIEVIRGPGATIWGANAVNGVINVITKSASETRGLYANAGGGSVEHGFAGARVGGRTNRGVDWRVSGKWFERGSFFDPTGRADDSSGQGRIGFRTDWKPQRDTHVTFQGDIYQGANRQTFDHASLGFSRDTDHLAGGNLLGRWSRSYSEDSDAKLQFYYDRTDRIASGFDQATNTIDIDYQYRCRVCDSHSVIWGLGHRNIWDNLRNERPIPLIAVTPQRRKLEWYSAFIQDEMTLLEDKLYVTLGTKLSHNTYTQFEVQPSVRMLWLPSGRSAFWAAFSRAVRTPTRATEDLILLGPPLPSPPFPPNTPMLVRGNRGITSEVLNAYECGFRKQVTQRFAWDAALFYNVYDDILSTRTVIPAAGLPFTQFYNGVAADAYGCEISARWDVNCCWKIQTWYSLLRVNATTALESTQTAGTHEDVTPINQAFLMSSWNLTSNLEADLITHYVDSIPLEGVPSYIDLDLRAAYRPSRNVEFTVVGQNLLDNYRAEYGGSSFTSEIATEVPRGVYGMLTLRY